MIYEWKKGAKYWDYPFNPVVGCKKVSAGCLNCYAERICRKFGQWKHHNFLPQPGNAKRPNKHGVVFVGNMTDIFGEWNTLEQIHGWITSLSRDAVNLILTKRPDRMLDYFREYTPDERDTHLWFGITIEDSREYLWRHRYLQLPVQMWVSAEPLLSDIDFEEPVRGWLVVGSESGPDRRPAKPEWVRHLVSIWRSRNLPVFVKQLEIDGKLEKDISKFPEDLQIRQVPWCKGAENVIR